MIITLLKFHRDVCVIKIKPLNIRRDTLKTDNTDCVLENWTDNVVWQEHMFTWPYVLLYI